MELVSIIVPIYNTEKYLRQCLLSIQQQSYENIEILLINDGTQDNSVDICHEFCQQDERFILIEQKNQGLGAAKNTGLMYAKGDYICFVDSDDYIYKDFVKILYDNLKLFDADISMCNYEKFRDGEETHIRVDNKPIQLDRKQMLLDISTTGVDNSSERVVVSWNKMIRVHIFKNLRFVNEIHEDEFMIQYYLLSTDKVVWTDAELYYYRQRASSIMGGNNSKDLGHLVALDAIRMRLTTFTDKEFEDVFPSLVESYFENATSYYYIYKNKSNMLTMKYKIYPQYCKVLIQYRSFLTKSRFKQYMVFLISPWYYCKKYWLKSC